MKYQSSHIVVELECPDCAATLQIEEYDAMSISEVENKDYSDYECPECGN